MIDYGFVPYYDPDDPDPLYHVIFRPEPGTEMFKKFIALVVDRALIYYKVDTNEIEVDIGEYALTLMDMTYKVPPLRVPYDDYFRPKDLEDWCRSLA